MWRRPSPGGAAATPLPAHQMTHIKHTRWAKRLGILLGVVLAGAALAAWRVPGGESTLGADIRVDAVQTGEIGVSPVRPFVNAASLLPGGSAAGHVALRNQTGVPLRVRLRALPSTPDLDSLAQMRIESGSRTLFTGSLGELRRAGTGPLALAPGASRKLHVGISLPTGLRSGYQGRIVDITLQLDSAKAR
jgi:hypothetical protein